MPLRDFPRNGLLRKFPFLRTDKPERARNLLFEHYRTRRFDVLRGGEDFCCEVNRVPMAHVGFHYFAFGAEVEIEFPEIRGYCQQITLSGDGETTLDGKRIPPSFNETCLIPPGSAIETRFDGRYRQLLLRIDPAALRGKLEAVLGVAIPAAPQFQSAASFQSPGLRNLRRLAQFLVDELESQESQSFPLALAELEQALIVSFLCGHQHNYSHLLERPPASAAPWQIQRTEAYIEANWGKPITIEAISEAVGISVRSIFHSFKQHRSYSPMTFLKETRLARAREMLDRGDAGASVTGAAYSCGFQSHGHFAREYRRRFGELPSETLARSRAR